MTPAAACSLATAPQTSYEIRANADPRPRALETTIMCAFTRTDAWHPHLQPPRRESAFSATHVDGLSRHGGREATAVRHGLELGIHGKLQAELGLAGAGLPAAVQE